MVSSIGTWMEGLGVQWLMAEQTGSSVMLGWLAAAQLGPMLVLGMFGGLATDRLDRRKLLLVTQTIMMLIAVGLAVASAADLATPPVLLALGLLNGVAMAFNTPAWQVLTPRLVPRAELHRAIAHAAIDDAATDATVRAEVGALSVEQDDLAGVVAEGDQRVAHEVEVGDLATSVPWSGENQSCGYCGGGRM